MLGYKKMIKDRTLEFNQRRMYGKMEERVKNSRLTKLENHALSVSDQISESRKVQKSSVNYSYHDLQPIEEDNSRSISPDFVARNHKPQGSLTERGPVDYR